MSKNITRYKAQEYIVRSAYPPCTSSLPVIMHWWSKLRILVNLVLKANRNVVRRDAPRPRASPDRTAHASDERDDEQQRHDEDVSREQPNGHGPVLVEQRGDRVRARVRRGHTLGDVRERTIGSRRGARRHSRGNDACEGACARGRVRGWGHAEAKLHRDFVEGTWDLCEDVGVDDEGRCR